MALHVSDYHQSITGATFNKLYSAIGTCRYVWLLYSGQTYRSLYNHCNMMHGTYNVNLFFVCNLTLHIFKPCVDGHGTVRYSEGEVFSYENSEYVRI